MKHILIVKTFLVTTVLLSTVSLSKPKIHHHKRYDELRSRTRREVNYAGQLLFSPESPATNEVKGYINQKEAELKERIKYANRALDVIGNVDAISYTSRSTTIQDKVADVDEYDIDYFYSGTHFFVKIGAKVRVGTYGGEQYLYFHIRMFKSAGNNPVEIVGMDESPYVKNRNSSIQSFGLFGTFIENVKDPLNFPRLKDSGNIVDPKDRTKIILRPKINYN